jgi:predicted nucleic acid-binding protein
VAALVDSNVLVYCFDSRWPAKQQAARRRLRAGLTTGTVRVPHQALMEFLAATTRRRGSDPPLLSEPDAWHEMQNFMSLYPVLYPSDAVLRTAVQGAALYRLPWFDAHLWAYAEVFELDELLSEDFTHGRQYGRVRAINPFLA